MARFTDDIRTKAKALWDAREAAGAALDTFEDENAEKLEKIDAQYEPLRAGLAARHQSEWDVLSERQNKESDALEAEVRKGKGTTELHAALDATEKALDSDDDTPGLKTTWRGDDLLLCATSGKPILEGEDTVATDGLVSIAAEVEARQAASAEATGT